MALLDEKLISFVQYYPVLHDLSHKDYYNIITKEGIWDEISNNLNESLAVLRKRWNNLRSYRKALLKRKTKSGQAATKKNPWKYEEQMSFLNYHFSGTRQQMSNMVTIEVEELGFDGLNSNVGQSLAEELGGDKIAASSDAVKKHTTPATSVTPKKKKTESKPTTAAVLQNYLVHKEQRRNTRSDHLTSFFKAAEDTVRTFKPLLQIEIKAKVSSLLAEYEMQNLLASQECNI